MKTRNDLPPHFTLSSEVARARTLDLPLVALESTVITHGLPYPENLEAAKRMESEVRGVGATPATIAVLEGTIHVGLNEIQLERLARSKDAVKMSARDLGIGVAGGLSGGTTVAATLVIAHAVGIKVFATGGIGGVHRGTPHDVSADLTELSRTPLVVVCAGAKAILDLPATLEMLETLEVPVIGYQTADFPAFYSTTSGHKVTVKAKDAEQVAQIANAHWGLGQKSAVLVTVPPPAEEALPSEKVEGAIRQALRDAEQKELHGQDVTPFLLQRVSELTGGSSLRVNLALLRNNARIGGLIARFMVSRSKAIIA